MIRDTSRESSPRSKIWTLRLATFRTPPLRDPCRERPLPTTRLTSGSQLPPWRRQKVRCGRPPHFHRCSSPLAARSDPPGHHPARRLRGAYPADRTSIYLPQRPNRACLSAPLTETHSPHFHSNRGKACASRSKYSPNCPRTSNSPLPLPQRSRPRASSKSRASYHPSSPSRTTPCAAYSDPKRSLHRISVRRLPVAAFLSLRGPTGR